MDPSGTQKTTLPVTKREDLLGTPRSKTPATQKNTGTPRSSTPRHIKLLSPGIDCSYSLSRSSKIMTPEIITPPKILS